MSNRMSHGAAYCGWLRPTCQIGLHPGRVAASAGKVPQQTTGEAVKKFPYVLTKNNNIHNDIC